MSGQVADAVAGPAARGGRLRETWVRHRNRLLASGRFQRLASRTPLVRLIARRRARALFDLSAGFVYSQVLLACVRLDVFSLLAEGPLDVRALGQSAGLSDAAMRRLLDAAASLRLVDSLGSDRYALGALGASLRGNPGVEAMILHHPALYQDLADPVARLRERSAGALTRLWSYVDADDPAGLDGESVADYSALMAASQQVIAGYVLDAFSLSGCRHLVDVAGGEGVFASAAAGRWPRLRVTVFDLPAVAARARSRFSRDPGRGRLAAQGGNVFTDPLPAGADAVSLVRVLHDHDDAAARAILERVRAALPPGGRLIVAEPMAGTPGAEPAGDAYFGFYLLAMGSGRPRRFEELTRFAREAGFKRVREVSSSQPMLVRVLVAQA